MGSRRRAGSVIGRCGELRVNVGCGQSPTPGYVNFDNSLSLALPSMTSVASILVKLKLIDQQQASMRRVGRRYGIRRAEATRLPLPDQSAAVLYSSHMIEHLSRRQAIEFLLEARRVLRPRGILRIVVPDLRRLVEEYEESGDADRLVERTLLAAPPLDSAFERLKMAIIGNRHHLWMYDERSLCALVKAAGFVEPVALPPGETQIPQPGALDLREREEESIYVEAHNP